MKKVTAIILAMIMIFTVGAALAGHPCGDGVYCWLTEENGWLEFWYDQSFTSPGVISEAVWDKTKVKLIKMDEGIGEIKAGIFKDHTNLKNVYLPESMTKIGDNAFRNDVSLRSIWIPKNVTSIGDNAFTGITGLVIQAEAGSYAEKWAKSHGFRNNNNEPEPPPEPDENGPVDYEFNLGATVAYRTGLISVPLSGTYTVVSSNSEIIRPVSISRVVSITYGSTASVNFEVKMTGVSPGVATIQIVRDGSSSYWNLKVRVVDPNAPEEPEEPEEPEPDPEPPSEITFNGLKYKLDNENKSAFFVGPENEGIKTLTIPETILVEGSKYKVTEIGDYACTGLDKLTKVTIGKNIKKIGRNAFYKAAALKTVAGGAGVNNIGEYAFGKCVKLKNFPVMKNLKKIGEGAFSECKMLPSFTFEAKVANIGKKAYYGCSKMKTLKIRTKKLKASAIGENAFGKTYTKMKVKCVKGKAKAYRILLEKKGLSNKALWTEE